MVELADAFTEMPAAISPMSMSESTDPQSPQVVVYTDVNIIPEQDNQEFDILISRLQALRTNQRNIVGKRREALDRILDIKGSIRVFCRVRPSPSTNYKKIQPSISTAPEKITVRSTGTNKEFTVDRVFDQEATQEDIFREGEPIIRSALDGSNVCIFAYGQTGTGKTFTMEGTNDRPGIVPRALEELFRRASIEKSAPLTFSMSMLEVYMGNIRDLLVIKQPSKTGSNAKSSLSILSDRKGSVEIEGLVDIKIDNLKQANRLYVRGKRARSTSWTNVNKTSSRSHCLTRITIGRSGDMGGSKLWMVDLGGSERLLKTGATGQTLDEGKAINLSLSALADVIAALKKKHNHIPYRNSKLTQILKDSLGDGSRAVMLVHISPSENDVGESMCSLSFAKRARAIEPNRELSEDTKKQKEKFIAEIEQQINDYEEQLQEVMNQIEKTEMLIEEKKKLYPIAYQLHKDQKGSATSLLPTSCEDNKESPRTAAGKLQLSSVPRFMTSTACSRQRKNTVVETINSRGRTSNLRNSDTVNFAGSRSLTNLDLYSKTKFPIMKTKLAAIETNISKQRKDVMHLCNQENLSCNSVDTKSFSSSRKKTISTSNPNFRVVLQHHRRRMSDLT